jgi:hypothetical protein
MPCTDVHYGALLRRGPRAVRQRHGEEPVGVRGPGVDGKTVPLGEGVGLTATPHTANAATARIKKAAPQRGSLRIACPPLLQHVGHSLYRRKAERKRPCWRIEHKRPDPDLGLGSSLLFSSPVATWMPPKNLGRTPSRHPGGAPPVRLAHGYAFHSRNALQILILRPQSRPMHLRCGKHHTVCHGQFELGGQSRRTQRQICVNR